MPEGRRERWWCLALIGFPCSCSHSICLLWSQCCGFRVVGATKSLYQTTESLRWVWLPRFWCRFWKVLDVGPGLMICVSIRTTCGVSFVLVIGCVDVYSSTSHLSSWMSGLERLLDVFVSLIHIRSIQKPWVEHFCRGLRHECTASGFRGRSRGGCSHVLGFWCDVPIHLPMCDLPRAFCSDHVCCILGTITRNPWASFSEAVFVGFLRVSLRSGSLWGIDVSSAFLCCRAG